MSLFVGRLLKSRSFKDCRLYTLEAFLSGISKPEGQDFNRFVETSRFNYYIMNLNDPNFTPIEIFRLQPEHFTGELFLYIKHPYFTYMSAVQTSQATRYSPAREYDLFSNKKTGKWLRKFQGVING